MASPGDDHAVKADDGEDNTWRDFWCPTGRGPTPPSKSRGSNSGPAGCGYIYASEVNQCPCWRHKLKVTPQNSPGYDRTVRFELPNYGFLENVFLETLFSANSGMDNTGDGTSVDTALCWGAGAYVFSEVRLVFSRVGGREAVLRLHPGATPAGPERGAPRQLPRYGRRPARRQPQRGSIRRHRDRARPHARAWTSADTPEQTAAEAESPAPDARILRPPLAASSLPASAHTAPSLSLSTCLLTKNSVSPWHPWALGSSWLRKPMVSLRASRSAAARLSQRIREFRDWVMITAASRPSLAAAVRP